MHSMPIWVVTCLVFEDVDDVVLNMNTQILQRSKAAETTFTADPEMNECCTVSSLPSIKDHLAREPMILCASRIALLALTLFGIKQPPLTKQDIQDRSKAIPWGSSHSFEPFGWCPISSQDDRNLSPLEKLELATSGFVCCAIIMYLF